MYPAQAAIFDISPCTNLRSLTLGLTLDAGRHLSSADTMANLLNFLSFTKHSDMSLSYLEELTFQVAFEAEGDPKQLWDTWFERCKDTLTAVDNALLDFALRWDLAAVSFECYLRKGDLLDLSDAMSMLSQVFSHLHAQAKLQFRRAALKKWMVLSVHFEHNMNISN